MTHFNATITYVLDISQQQRLLPLFEVDLYRLLAMSEIRDIGGNEGAEKNPNPNEPRAN